MYDAELNCGYTIQNMRKMPRIPIRSTATPMMTKIHTHEEERLRSNAIKPPKTARIATRGIMALMPSAVPRLSEVVLSVSHALN